MGQLANAMLMGRELEQRRASQNQNFLLQLQEYQDRHEEQQDRLAAAGKSADAFAKAVPEFLSKTGIDESTWKNLAARDKAAAMDGYVTAQKFKQFQAQLSDEANKAKVAQDFSGFTQELPAAQQMAPTDPRLGPYYEGDANEMPDRPVRPLQEYMPEVARRFPMAPQHNNFNDFVKLLQTSGANADNLPPEQVLIGDKGAEVPYVWKRGSREFQPRADVMLKGRSDLSAQRFDEQGRLIDQRGQVQGDLQDTRLKTQRELQAERLAAAAESRAATQEAVNARLERRHELGKDVVVTTDPVTGKNLYKGSQDKVAEAKAHDEWLANVKTLQSAKKNGAKTVRMKDDGSLETSSWNRTGEGWQTIDQTLTQFATEPMSAEAPPAPKPANDGKAVGGYKIGTIYGGLRYKGGDPNQQANWEKAR